MALLQGTKVGMRKLDSSVVDVGSNPFAKLGYYINSINRCIDLVRDDAFMLRFKEAYGWSEAQKDQVVALALLLGPDVVLGKVVHVLPDGHPLLEGYANEWYEISAVRTTLAVTEQVVIGGEQKTVGKIMVCKKSWYENNYLQPMIATVERLKRASPHPQIGYSPRYGAAQGAGHYRRVDSGGNDCCCAIL